MKTRQEIKDRLLKQYISPELRARANSGFDALRELWAQEILAEIDAGTIYWLQPEINRQST